MKVRRMFKLLLIFISSIFFIITPVLGNDKETFDYIPIKVKIVDLENNSISGVKLSLLNYDGTKIGGSDLTKEDGIIWNYSRLVNTNDRTMDGYCVEFVLFYYSGENSTDPFNTGRPLEIIGGSKRCFENNSLNYTVVVNELNNIPAPIVLYDMTRESYNLSKQSKETSDNSLTLSKLAFIFALISLLCEFNRLINILTAYLIKIYKKIFKH